LISLLSIQKWASNANHGVKKPTWPLFCIQKTGGAMAELIKNFTSVAGCKTCIRRGGQGRPLVLLHGAGGSGNLLALATTLADHADVILPDHPGFGESDLPEWLDTIHDAAYFHLDLLAALRVDKALVVGFSLGGWIALEMAVRSTARIGGLVLAGAAGLNCPEVRRGDIFMWEPAERIRAMIHDPALAERVLAMPLTPEQEGIAVKNEFATARLAWEPRFFDPHLHKWLHRIAVPTRIVWGQFDKVFPLPFGENLQRHIPGSMLEVIPACGHLPHVEKPEDLKRIVLDALMALP
jgi:pimeloyl-ACP methyl ester carboxylesterase